MKNKLLQEVAKIDLEVANWIESHWNDLDTKYKGGSRFILGTKSTTFAHLMAWHLTPFSPTRLTKINYKLSCSQPS